MSPVDDDGVATPAGRGAGWPFDLTGRVAVVTGAVSETGIGYATAELLARLGAAVLVTATSDWVAGRAEVLRAAGHDSHAVVADLTDPRPGELVAGTATRRWGRIDILVNNAGMVSVTAPDTQDGPVQHMTLQAWHAGLSRNLDTAFLMTRAALPLMTGRPGRIVMISSVTGSVMAMRADPVYAAAKAGMVGRTRALALDLASR